MDKLQISESGRFVYKQCQFACPWKGKKDIDGEWHCLLYYDIKQCPSTKAEV